MAKGTPQFRKPAKPLSYTEMVNKILRDPAYARFFHGELIKARKGNQAAKENVAAHFEFRPTELKALKLPKGFGTESCPAKCTDTTATTTNLFDFVTPVHVWPKKTKKH